MTHDELIRLQETNNKALISVREMIGDHPGFEPDKGALDLLEMLLYTQRSIERDIAAVSHGQPSA